MPSNKLCFHVHIELITTYINVPRKWWWTVDQKKRTIQNYNKLQPKQQKVGGLVFNSLFSYSSWYHVVRVAYDSSASARLKMIVVIIISNSSTFEDKTDGGGGDESSNKLGQVPLTLAFAARDSLSKVNCYARTSNHFHIFTCLQLLYVKWLIKWYFDYLVDEYNVSPPMGKLLPSKARPWIKWQQDK